VDNNRYDNFLKEFGKQVRLIRKERGMTMEAVAYKAGIEYRQLGRIERGEVNATLISLLKISEALDVELQSFFSADTSKK
jgi:transcriptional regulator with XRE-family HTH domain